MLQNSSKENQTKLMTDPDITKIIIEKLPDGSWKGNTVKFGKELEVREAKPEDVLVRLLTHPGE